MVFSASASEDESAYRSAQVTCAIVAEMRFWQRADAIREINVLRERLNKEPFLEGYKVLNRAIDAEICVNLALNEPDWLDRLEQIEAEKAQREAAATNSDLLTSSESSLAAPTAEQSRDLAKELKEQLERAKEREVNGANGDEVAAFIQAAIITDWKVPPSVRNGMKAELEIALVPTGDVVGVSVLTSSGDNAFDRSAINAVERVGRFPEVKQLDRALFERDFRRLRIIFQPQDLRY